MKPTIALAAGFVFVLAACGGGDPTDVGAETTGSIRGTVTDNGGATVPNAAVALTGNAQAAQESNRHVLQWPRLDAAYKSDRGGRRGTR